MAVLEFHFEEFQRRLEIILFTKIIGESVLLRRCRLFIFIRALLFRRLRG